MAFYPDDLTRLIHLVDLADRVSVVTNGHEKRIEALEQGGTAGVLYNTTAYWNEQRNFIPGKGAIVIYSDRSQVDGADVPAFKVGDGMAYLIDLPFSGDDLLVRLENHINDDTRHLTSNDRERLDNSMRVTFVEQGDGSYTALFN